MSFDFYVLPPRPGEDPGDAFERLECEDDLGDPDPAAEARNERLAAVLREAQPEMCEHQDKRSRSFVGDVLEIFLSAQYAELTVDYVRAEDRAALAAELHVAVRLITAETGWVVYDAQSQQVISPVADAEDYRRALNAALQAEERRPPSLLKRLLRRT